MIRTHDITLLGENLSGSTGWVDPHLLETMLALDKLFGVKVPPTAYARLWVVIAILFVAIGLTTPVLSLYLQSLGADLNRIALILATTAAVA